MYLSFYGMEFNPFDKGIETKSCKNRHGSASKGKS